MNSIISFLGRFTPQQTVLETQRRLTIAGNPFNLRVTQYYGFRVLFMIIGALISLAVFQADPSLLYLLLSLMLLVSFLGAPGLWLNAMMRQRQEEIRKSLPDALDMLSVCVSAGLSFDQALLRVGQSFKTPIGIEFARVVSEIEVGVSRREALRNLQARVDITELSSFVAVILQAETLGMSIADVLHSQAGQMRIYRQYMAKEIAQLLPAKMMVPLVVFIFPALWAVILGPTIPKLMEILR
jgi:tight adherence protein C